MMRVVFLLFMYVFITGCSSKNISLDEFDIEHEQKRNIEILLEMLFDDRMEGIQHFIDDNKIDIDIVDKNGKTLLLLAFFDENYDLSNKLLQLGADPNGSRASFMKMSLIGWAASYKNDMFLNLVLKYGGDPNLTSEGEWPASTPIFESIRINNKVNMELLIRSGADLNFEARGGFTPLMLAAAIGKWELLYILLNSESNYMYVNKFDKTVFTYIEMQGLGVDGEEGRWRKKVFSFLKGHGIALNPRVPL